MKLSKKAVSLLLAATMILSCFAIAIPFISFDALAADISIDGVSQTRVVSNYESVYENYAAEYLNGASNPTNIVIPGLDPAQDYVVQGMTYYPARDWMLVTVYHNVADGETTQSSKVFALDAKTGDFVAMFSFLNPDGSANTDHGGGIAVSEHNIYYSCGDKDRKIAYAPLSALANAPLNKHTKIQLVAEKDFVEIGSISSDSKTAYSAYVCYDEGILWVGNFYDLGAKLAGITIAAADYNAPSNSTYNSMVFGYELRGNSSAEEWDYLMGKFQNLVNVSTASGSGSASGSNFTWNAYQNGKNINIIGNITAPSATVGEFTANYGSFSLTEGVNYTIEFTSTNNSSDMYMFAPNGTHCNVKQSFQTTITKLEDGKYRYSMNFTAGLRPNGADSSWPTTQSTDGSYTGTYTIRFDQDSISAGEARSFSLTDIKISQANTYGSKESVYDEGCVGSPSYAIGLSNALKDVQYATVDNGKLYLSRSYGSGSGNSVSFGFGTSSFLTVADIDLSVPGTKEITISTKSTGSLDKKIKAYDISNYQDYAMMPMSEGLCVIDDNIFITFEGASNKYLNESSGLTSIGNCEKPVDVIWQLDPYELMEVEVAAPEKSIYYEKINNVDDIVDGEEYIILVESEEKSPVTQMPYLHALNAFGNFKDYKLSKSTGTVVNGYDGMIGHTIDYYSIVEEDGKTKLYLDNPEIDDVENIRWTLKKSGDNYLITSTDSYYANCNCLYIDENQITMIPSTSANAKKMSITNASDGENFWISNSGKYFLWCNKGNYTDKINEFYIKNSGSISMYAGLKEVDGTFHCDALNSSSNNIIGEAIATGEETHYKDGLFSIYKRVVNETSSTYESRVYTNLSASLQADGTYTVDLETYAISPNHYQYVGKRPTDYIIVADTSSSMAKSVSTGIIEYNGDLNVSSLSLEANTSDDNGTGISGYGFFNPDEDIYLKHTDGNYYKVFMAVNTTELKKTIGIITKMRQKYYAYYVANDGLYYCIQDHAVNYTGRTFEEFQAWVQSGENESDYSTKTSNGTRRGESVYTGIHYRFDNINSPSADEHICINTLKYTAQNLVSAIAAENSQNRIALVQYGASNGYYNTSGSLVSSGYTDAFWSTSNASTLNSKISALTTGTQSDNSGIEMTYVNNIIANSGANYKSDGTRNLVIIFMSDGIPGADSNSDTTGAANNVIEKALTAKNNGAFIYSILIGNNSSGSFNKKAYMDAVSSKYAGASSMTSLGGQSVDGINYALNLAICSIGYYVDFGNLTLTETSRNNAVGLDNLDANSYLREQLSDAFIFPEGWTVEENVKTSFVPGEYDAIGRFSFGTEQDATNVTTNVDTANKIITVTGYDYSKRYISRGNAEGKALKVTITGLIANKDAKIQNTSINNTETTGLYKTKNNMDNNVEFRLLPTEYFNIPVYSYTLDFGMDMLDTDVNGTLLASSYTLGKQDVNNYNKGDSDDIVRIASGNENLIYSLDSDTTNNKQYVLIQRTEGENATGEYDWFCIKLSPASNVYYEENKLEKSKSGKVSWENEGSPKVSFQTPVNPETDIHGYDSGYAQGVNSFSNESAKKVTISNSAKTSDTQKFTFTGTGFDLISACGPNTGIMTVKVTDSNKKTVKAYVIDTYYAGTDNLLYQTPIVSFKNDSGITQTYDVEVSAVYLSTAGALAPTPASITETEVADGVEMTTAVAADNSAIYDELAALGMNDFINSDLELVWFDDNSILNGGTGAHGTEDGIEMADGETKSLYCYLDGFRIYHPLGKTNELYIDSEQNANYVNVINELANGNIGSQTSIGNLAYIAGSLADGETLSFSNYQSVGPKNEFYLKGGTGALAFTVSLPNADSKVHLGLRAVTGTAKVTVGSGDKALAFDVKSATEMYYDISDYVSVNNGVATITIQNTGEGMLALNTLKLTGGASTVAVSEDDLSTYALSMSAPAEEAFVVNGKVTTNKEEIQPDVTEKTFIEKLVEFIKNIFVYIVNTVKNVFAILSKGGF